MQPELYSSKLELPVFRYENGAYQDEIFAEGVDFGEYQGYQVYRLNQSFRPRFQTKEAAFAFLPERSEALEYYLEVPADKKVGFFSDTHFHSFNYSHDNFRELSEIFAGLDVIILNGDVFDLWVSDFYDSRWFWDIAQVLEDNISNEKQVVFIPGNHDEYIDPIKQNDAGWMEQVHKSKQTSFSERVQEMCLANQARFAESGIDAASTIQFPLPVNVIANRLKLRHGDDYYVVEHGHDELLSGEFLSKKLRNNPFARLLTDRRILARASVLFSEVVKHNPLVKEALGHNVTDLYQHLRFALGSYGEYLDEDICPQRAILVTGHVHQEALFASSGLVNIGSFISNDPQMDYIIRFAQRMGERRSNSFATIDKEGIAILRKEIEHQPAINNIQPFRSVLFRLIGDMVINTIV